jgi:hypothetical protein
VRQRREQRIEPLSALRPPDPPAPQSHRSGAHEGRLIADVVRLDKGHTEGLEPRITETLVRLMVEAPGGKVQRLATA